MLQRCASLLFLVPGLLLSPLVQAADFVGSESCRVCHQAAYEQWRQSAHARAHTSLGLEQQKDSRCLQCHARDQAQGGDPGVTCETCHGAGQYYSPTYVMRDPELAKATGLVVPDPKSCGLCHDASSPSLQPFDVAQKLKQIDHWTAERAARQKQGTKRTERCPRTTAPAQHAQAHPAGTFLGQALRQPAASAGTAAALTAVHLPSQGAERVASVPSPARAPAPRAD